MDDCHELLSVIVEESEYWYDHLEKHIGWQSLGKILCGYVTQPEEKFVKTISPMGSQDVCGAPSQTSGVKNIASARFFTLSNMPEFKFCPDLFLLREAARSGS